MSTRPTRINKKAGRIACAWLITQAIVLAGSLTAQAQFAQPLVPGGQSGGQQGNGQQGSGGYADSSNGYTSQRTPLIQGAPNTPPYQQAQEGAPPPPGDGNTPKDVTAGDNGAPQAPGSDQADMTHGNVFPAGQGQNRSTVYIFSQGNQGRGNRMVQTLTPSTLTANQKQQIGSILGVNMDSGEQAINANASPSQLAQIQNILAPYPTAQNEGGRNKINDDAPAPNVGINKPGNESLYTYQGPLPTVRTFARYLVILGVVSATVWMALAAYSVVMGNPYGGARVISAAAGLMLLLGSYTIWKIVQMNTFKDNSNTPAVNQSKSGGGNVSDAYMNPPNVPGTPTDSRQNPQRFGIPLVPLGASINR
jgi:hypothetical protein